MARSDWCVHGRCGECRCPELCGCGCHDDGLQQGVSAGQSGSLGKAKPGPANDGPRPLTTGSILETIGG